MIFFNRYHKMKQGILAVQLIFFLQH